MARLLLFLHVWLACVGLSWSRTLRLAATGPLLKGGRHTISTSLRNFQRPGAAACPRFSDYTRLHRAILSGKVPPSERRFLVTSDNDGLADRLVNAVSAFYIALLTGRALCIEPVADMGPDGQPGLETAFDLPNIDWTCKSMRDPTGGGDGVRRYPDPYEEWNPTEDFTWLLPSTEVYETFVHSNLNDVGPANASTIRLYMHRGISVALFNNPHHAWYLTQFGLRPDTAFGCALNYLLRPSAATLAPLASPSARPLLEMLNNPYKITIGIQVRLGDDLISNQPADLDSLVVQARSAVNNFFACAQELQNDIMLHMGIPKSRIQWYIMTDTVAVRRAALEQFGRSQVVAFEDTAIEFFQSVTPGGLRLTALEHWLFSLCSYHIITGTSGMGRTAAAASLRHGSIFTLDHLTAQRLEGRSCRLADHDSPLHVYNTWSGV